MSNKKIKNILRSKTFLVALLQGIIGVVAVFAFEMPEVGGILVAKMALDIALRLATGEPVEFRIK